MMYLLVFIGAAFTANFSSTPRAGTNDHPHESMASLVRWILTEVGGFDFVCMDNTASRVV